MVVELEPAAKRSRIAGGEERATARSSLAISLRVFRHNPGSGAEGPRMDTYLVPITKGMTVLDALLWVKEHTDPGLAFRYSCRMGICGSCGMLINGEPRLGCETQVADLGTAVVEVGPLPNYPVIRDVATDFRDFFSHHRRVKPFLIREENGSIDPVDREFLQTEEEKLAYSQFTMCIMCGLCDAACPVVATDSEFLGPQALAQAYRFAADTRDRGWPERTNAVDTPHGCFRCDLAGSCSAVCPKGVDPAMGVQLLKRIVLRRRLRRGDASPDIL